MDLENYKDGKSMQRPRLFEANCFIYWKNRFETYVKSKDIDLWYILVYGNYKPTIKDKYGKDVIITYEKYDENHKKMISKIDEAKMVLYNALPKKEYERIFMCDTAQDIWKYLIITHQGNKQVKDNKIDLFVQKCEEFSISDDETIDCAFSRFNTTITSLKARDESFSSHELIGNLKVYEVVLEKDLEISKNKKEKYKSLSLKERKVLSEEEATSSDSNDEEYAMAVRDFKKFFRRRGKFVRQPHDEKRNFRKVKEYKKEKDDQRCFKCGDPNHFISDCPKHSFSDQKAFVVGCWSDSEDDSNKEGICLMALDNNEVRLKVKLEPDEWIKDSGCSRNMTGNKDLFPSYKTIDGGNVVFGGNTKSKIVEKGVETIVYADSDHAGDYVDRKSTSGVCTFMGCCLTSWFPKKQTALAISTIKAEYVSAKKACQQALWMKQALVDYDINLDDIPVLCNNKGAINLSKNLIDILAPNI
ncbi:zf-CCHC domain-containing protein [Tanacetum coccineum]